MSISGFFLSTALSTITAQTGEWTIITGSLIVSCNEILSKVYYSNKNSEHLLLNIVSYIRIGLVYGLFVDAFKLGS